MQIHGGPGGRAQVVKLEKKLEDVGPCISIALSEDVSSTNVWTIEVFVQYQTLGNSKLGQFVTNPPAAGDPPNRIVAFANCPGAKGWSVQARCTNPQAVADLNLDTSLCSSGSFGVIPNMPIPVDTDCSPYVCAPAPLGGGLDDAPGLQDVINTVPAGSIVILKFGGLYTWNTPIRARANITLDLNGADITFSSPYDITNSPINFPSPIPASTDTTTADVQIGKNSFPVTNPGTWAIGDYFFSLGDRGGRSSFRITDIVGSNLITDVPAWFLIENGCNLYKYVPLQNFQIWFNNATLHGSFTGPFADSRVIELVSTWNCTIEGPGIVKIDSAANGDPVSMVGFDQGGRGNVIERIKCIGKTPSIVQVSTGVALEGQVGSSAKNIEGENVGYAGWLNSSHDCDVDNLRSNDSFGILLCTSASVSTPNNEQGCRGNRFSKIECDGLLANGIAINLGSDTSYNTFHDVQIRGGTAIPASTYGIQFGADGTKPNVGNIFGGLQFDGITQALRDGGTNNIGTEIDSIVLNNVAQIQTMNPGSSCTIDKISGNIVTNAGISFGIAGASLVINNVELLITRTTGNVWTNVGPGTFTEQRNVRLTQAGAGYNYGFINSSQIPGARIELENAELGAFATNSFLLFPGDAVRERGRVTYTGTVSAGAMLARTTVVVAGATAKFVPFPGIDALEIVSLPRLTTGGTVGNPAYAITIDADGNVGLPATWAPSGLVGWPGSAPNLVEDNANSSHALATAAAGFVRGPVVLFSHVVFTSRNAVKIGTGGKYAIFKSDGTQQGVDPSFFVWQVSDGAGGWYCFEYNPDMATPVVEFFMENPAGTDVYLGNGSGVSLSNASPQGLPFALTLLGKLSITDVAGSSSTHAVNIG